MSIVSAPAGMWTLDQSRSTTDITALQRGTSDSALHGARGLPNKANVYSLPETDVTDMDAADDRPKS